MSSTQKKWLGMSGSGVVAGARRRGAPIVPTGEQESKLRLGLTVTRPSRESPVTPAGREMVSTSHQLMPIAPALVNLCGPRDQGQPGSSSRRAGAMEGWGKSERSSPASPCDQPAGVNQYRESACSKQTGMAIPGDASDIHTGSRLALSAAELPATEERPSFIRPWRNPVNHRLPAVASKHVTRHELQRRRSRRCHLFALGRRTSASLSGSWPESGDGDFQICPPPGARIPVTGGIMRLTRAETLPSPRGSDLSEPLPLCLGAKHQGSIALDLAPPPPPPPSGKRQLL